MRLDSKVELKHLKVDGGMTNGDLAMQVLADVGGFGVVRPEMREYVFLPVPCAQCIDRPGCLVHRSTALGSALLAGSAIGFCGWDINKPETLLEVNTRGSRTFKQEITNEDKEKRYKGWKRAVERSKGWAEVTTDND